MTHLIRTTALAAAMATAAAAGPMVSEIDVTADLSAIENYQAAKVWTSLETDLETALAQQLIGQIAEAGASETAEINVEIDSVALASNFEQALGVGEWVLKGDVDIDMPDASQDMRYDLTVSADQVNAYYPQGTDPALVTVDSELFYNAIIDAFAGNVASKLK
ncbi:hypothetical protein KUW17_11945 [Leisingera aquaemixtae]|uniref:hypothetical protein n=1 Tax=Leisingera TaxID=191028 RepID=UPI001C940B74|nr:MULTISPECIES: hypothetical protein [Leisingera]MBY6067457.1 hypothetical protein [Leisingera aquaemixtae]MCB4454794.1 hypothetical protein [Leisingera sp. McT4-56]